MTGGPGAGWRRLGEVDATFSTLDQAVAGEATPVSLQVFDRGFPDQHAVEHLREVIARLLPALRCRLERDPLSIALPRWVDVPRFDVAEHMSELPVPGDGSLRAILDWAAEWGNVPLPKDRPPWRMVFFRDVTVDGVPGRMVSLTQIHHSVIDGEGGKRMAERFLQWGPDEPMPEMPAPEPPEEITVLERWREGWAAELEKMGGVARAGGRRAAFAVRYPRAAARRARELRAALGRLNRSTGTAPLSPLLRRQSDRLRFDVLEVADLPALKAGARAAGGTVNDGVLAALSLALRRWHRHHGVAVPELRLTMAVNVRPDDGGYGGNALTGALARLPTDDDDLSRLVSRCHALSLAARDDTDMVRLLEAAQKLANRGPAKAVARMSAKRLAGTDVVLSNVNGIPSGFYLGGVENLRTMAFMGAFPGALQIIMGSTRERADLGITTCPAAIRDPEHLVSLLSEALDEVAKLAG